MLALWIVMGSLLALWIVAYIVYRMAFYSPKKGRDDPYHIFTGEEYAPWKASFSEWMHALDARPCEPVTMVARDGTVLAARYYHVRDGAPLSIQMHGYRSHALRDFCGGAPMAMDVLGHNVLLVDQRAHGKSEGHTISFGIRERYDCLDWIHYALRRFGEDTPIVLYGISMGAATVLMASEFNLPQQVCGIVADCPYSSPADIIRKVCHDRRIPVPLAYPFLCLGASLYGRFTLSRKGPHPVQAVRHTRVPILIIHGQADTFVPCDMSVDIHRACPSMIRLELFEGAVHAGCYLVDPQRYRSIICQAMREWNVAYQEPNELPHT